MQWESANRGYEFGSGATNRQILDRSVWFEPSRHGKKFLVRSAGRVQESSSAITGMRFEAILNSKLLYHFYSTIKNSKAELNQEIH